VTGALHGYVCDTKCGMFFEMFFELGFLDMSLSEEKSDSTKFLFRTVDQT
jgi:hypothetical protein